MAPLLPQGYLCSPKDHFFFFDLHPPGEAMGLTWLSSSTTRVWALSSVA